jgi:hypothetical protein
VGGCIGHHTTNPDYLQDITLGPLVVSVAAGEGFGDLVPGVLHRALGLLDAPFVSAVDQQAVNGPEEPHRAARDAGEL